MMIRPFARPGRLVWVGCVGFSLVLAGCGGSKSSGGREEGEVNLQRLVILLNMHRPKNNGQLPPNEEAFKKFLKTLKGDELKLQGITDVDACLISPRDKKPYVINYKAISGTPPIPTKPGQPKPSGGVGRQIIAWEQEGSGGKRYVAYADGGSVVLMSQSDFDEVVPK